MVYYWYPNVPMPKIIKVRVVSGKEADVVMELEGLSDN